MTTRAPIVVGIDPSLTATGIAFSDGYCCTVGRSGITVMHMEQAVVAVDRLVAEILKKVAEHLPETDQAVVAGGLIVPLADLFVIERLTKSKFSGGMLERGALWWLLVRALCAAGAPVAVVMPANRMLYATGKGSAAKGAVIDAVARRLPQFETKGDDNLADAAIFVAMGADYLTHPLAVFPAAHRKALQAVDWPQCPPWTEW